MNFSYQEGTLYVAVKNKVWAMLEVGIHNNSSKVSMLKLLTYLMLRACVKVFQSTILRFMCNIAMGPNCLQLNP